MPPTVPAIDEPLWLSLPSSDTDPEPDRDPGPSPMTRVQQTARKIEDRVRRALNPTGAAIATLRVLVVDDQPDVADSLAAVLELLGCEVRVSYTGAAALVVAGEFDPQICLLD